MRKKFRFLTVLAVCVMVLSCFSVTAFAYADDTEQNLPVTEATCAVIFEVWNRSEGDRLTGSRILTCALVVSNETILVN